MKRLLLLAAAVVSIGVISIITYFYISSFRSISITHTNTANVSVINQETGDVVAEGIESGSVVKIKKEDLHLVDYSGAEGYADGSIAIAESVENITIDPDFSIERNTQLAAELTPIIKKLLDESHPLHANYFTISDVTLRDKGSWMKATLSYKGEYNFNSDDLHVLLVNSDSTWELIGEPEIVFTTKKYPDTPREILVWANGEFTSAL